MGRPPRPATRNAMPARSTLHRSLSQWSVTAVSALCLCPCNSAWASACTNRVCRRLPADRHAYSRRFDATDDLAAAIDPPSISSLTAESVTTLGRASQGVGDGPSQALKLALARVNRISGPRAKCESPLVGRKASSQDHAAATDLHTRGEPCGCDGDKQHFPDRGDAAQRAKTSW